MHGACGTDMSGSAGPTISTIDFTQDIRTVIELQSERSLYVSQRDTAEKKFRERQNELERCQTSNFSSVNDILEYQLKTADAERMKASQRIVTIDEKLADAGTAYMQKLWAALDNKIVTATKGINDHLTPPPSETSDHPMFDTDEKLAWLKDTIEPAIATRVAEETQKFQSTTIAGYEARIEELSLRLDQEKAARSAAEQKLDNFASRLHSMEAALEGVTRGNITKENEAMKKDIARLEATVAKLDKQGASTSVEVSGQKDSIAELSKQVIAGTSEIRALADVRAKDKENAAKSNNSHGSPSDTCRSSHQALASTVEALRGQIDSLSPNKQSSTPADSRILELAHREISIVEERLQTNLKAIASKFGPVIDKEREERQALADRLTTTNNEVAEGAVSISDSIVAIKDLQSAFKNLQIRVHQQNGPVEMLCGQIKKLDNLAATTEAFKAEVHSGLEDLSMQLQGVTSWQNHFTSEALYESIVAHINVAFVQRFVQELQTLASKVDVVERSIDDSMKRRKMPSGHVDVAPVPPMT